MSRKSNRKLVYEDVLPILQKADNPGIAMRDLLINEGFELKDVIEICTSLAIAYKGMFDEKIRYAEQYREERGKYDT